MAVAPGNSLSPALRHPLDGLPALLPAPPSANPSRQPDPSAVNQLAQRLAGVELEEEGEPEEVPWYIDPDALGQHGPPPASVAGNGGLPWQQEGIFVQPPQLAFDPRRLAHPALAASTAEQSLWPPALHEPQWNGSALGSFGGEPVSYVDAWTQLMQVTVPHCASIQLWPEEKMGRKAVSTPEWALSLQACAIELELGRSILQEVERRGGSERFLASPKGAQFVCALGQLFLAAQILETAMSTHVQTARRPPTFSDSLRRCTHVWTEGIPAFRSQLSQACGHTFHRWLLRSKFGSPQPGNGGRVLCEIL